MSIHLTTPVRNSGVMETAEVSKSVEGTVSSFCSVGFVLEAVLLELSPASDAGATSMECDTSWKASLPTFTSSVNGAVENRAIGAAAVILAARETVAWARVDGGTSVLVAIERCITFIVEGNIIMNILCLRK